MNRGLSGIWHHQKSNARIASGVEGFLVVTITNALVSIMSDALSKLESSTAMNWWIRIIARKMTQKVKTCIANGTEKGCWQSTKRQKVLITEIIYTEERGRRHREKWRQKWEKIQLLVLQEFCANVLSKRVCSWANQLGSQKRSSQRRKKKVCIGMSFHKGCQASKT